LHGYYSRAEIDLINFCRRIYKKALFTEVRICATFVHKI